MRRHLTVIFAVTAWAAVASAQVAIPVGSGSFASFPPAAAGGTAQATANQSLFVVPAVSSNGVPSVPIPSNKWWTDLIIHQYAGNLWASPLSVSANAQGINISRPDLNTVFSGGSVFFGVNSQPEVPLAIQGQGFSPASSQALRWGDWTVSFRMQQTSSEFMDVTLGRGLPYMWIQFTGVTPQIMSPQTATYFDDNGDSISFPVTTNHFGLSYSNKVFGIFAPDNTQFSLSSNTITVTFADTNTYLVVGTMPSPTNLAYFSRYAYTVPTNSVMTWAYDPNAGAVTTSWHLATINWKGSETNSIQGWIPHHWRNTNNFVYNGIQYTVARGLMKCTTGNDYQIIYNFNGIPPIYPAPQQLGLTNDYNPALMNSYISNVASNTTYFNDTYNGGIALLRFAHHMAFANQLGRPEFGTLENALRTAVTNWFTYTPTNAVRFFAEYPGWRALVGFQASHGSDQFNDHHFHYGYFTHAIALLGMYDQAFLTNFGPMATLVAKEYANWDRTDTNFPVFRTFDMWEGHSWAAGFSGPIMGNNQESSGEAMNSWGGLFLLGSVLNNVAMRDAGVLGYAMESESTRQYYYNVPRFYNPNDSNWPTNYTATIVGILWNSGQEFRTFFGGSPLFVHAIQWLPPSPVMEYQAEDPNFTQYDFNNMLSEYGGTISSMGSQYGNFALGYVAQCNADYAAAQLTALAAANDPVSTDPTYAGATYYQAYALRTLGQRQWQFHINVPTSAVFFNTNTEQYSYVAYNPQPTSQVATVYSNNINVGHMFLPPSTLVTQNTIVAPGQIVTNIVQASVQDGVVVSWPTILGTNYQVQWATSPATNAAWSNLTAQITGDGTTNGVFDPFGPYQYKFYRVSQPDQIQAGILRTEAIRWFASNGVPYQVQWSSDNATWNNLGSLTTGAGSSNAVDDTFGQPGHNFYRVLSIE